MTSVDQLKTVGFLLIVGREGNSLKYKVGIFLTWQRPTTKDHKKTFNNNYKGEKENDS